MLKIKPAKAKIKRVGMVLSSQVSRLEMFDVIIKETESDYEMQVRLTKVDKSELLIVDNPRYD